MSDSLIADRRPRNLVTYFGGYASAMHDEFVHVHVLRDGDRETFCGLTDGLRYGMPREVGRAHKMCEECLNGSQGARRDGLPLAQPRLNRLGFHRYEETEDPTLIRKAGEAEWTEIKRPPLLTVTIERTYRFDWERIVADFGDQIKRDMEEYACDFEEVLRETFYEICGTWADKDDVDGNYIWLYDQDSDLGYGWREIVKAAAERLGVRIEADKAISEYDALELDASIMAEALGKIALPRINRSFDPWAFDPWARDVARQALAQVSDRVTGLRLDDE